MFIGKKYQNARNAVERCAPSGPQKHKTEESDRITHKNLGNTVTKKQIDPSCGRGEGGGGRKGEGRGGEGGYG